MLANLLSRRSFFGAAAGAAVAAPAIAADVAAPDVGFAGWNWVYPPTTGELLGGEPLRHGSAIPIRGRAIQFNDRPGDRYVYRTGHPSIDALRSVSGVHKERMERDWYPDNF